jgi:hypothetical protein
MVGPHAIGAERFLTVASGPSVAQVADAIQGKQTRAQTLIRTRSVRESVIDLAVLADPVLRRAHPGPPTVGRIYPGDNTSDADRRTAEPDARSASQGRCCRFAARAGDSRSVDGVEGL